MASLIPKDKRQLRACLICGIVQNHHVFRDSGCPNCNRYVNMAGQNDMVTDCTSGTFDGVMAVLQPKKSWVCKFAHVNTSQPGIYASHVYGRVPEDIEDTLTRQGITYHPRDGSADE
ncbi:transcription elongation factor spt4 [Coemansia sp. RSA 2523]|nr:transcription elongation factor spt4 [Coemansia sp. RSA 1591]KAJ1764058.1 transcription elongation factor spt4 [Coemansia sp. RSA 1752]KAJ1777615.1 transcription elongation factor spt4 [Coemansia sp. RSA 1824]KAJ1790722.1 transcription elongation factor spt4 [Coemansia sp. RSA 1938]KAJ1791224.1 transcription elongation factor spt4 [Coemansia sp. RSA 2167]KAJ1807918.1 transcription elongation factor spt4 [Coemansia sp. RSA 2523]KAJ2107407.1 transcription elongation factor spt4 [Coemansia sp